jgi:hypothetical protein
MLSAVFERGSRTLGSHCDVIYGNAGIKALEKPDVARWYLVRGGTPGSRFVERDSVRALIDLVEAQ